MIERISKLNDYVSQFAKYGLIPTFPASSFIEILSAASKSEVGTIRRVLEPYIEGMEARVNALRDLYDIINTYVTTLNSFLTRKNVDFNIRDGLTINSVWSEPLDPGVLSSGERQLLLLLSNTILARGRSSIFIIDEPELSLNVKWQRDLVDALLRCSHGGGIQYILASHSLELITQYKSRTVRLISNDRSLVQND